MYIPEATLEVMIRELVADIKQRYTCWADPYALCKALSIDLRFGQLGLNREGAAFAGAIVVDPTAGVSARRRFTLYHEIVHHLIRRNDVLYAALDEQYHSDRDLTNIRERLCQVGAAEFVLPASLVRAATGQHGWTIALVEELASSSGASRVATCVQLALLAPHRCLAVVCRLSSIPDENDQMLWDEAPTSHMALQVDVAMSSSTMSWSVACGTVIPSGHILTSAYEAAHGELVRGQAQIPFRSSTVWIVDCEAVRLGQQVLALFHVDPPPPPLGDQLRLF